MNEFLPYGVAVTEDEWADITLTPELAEEIPVRAAKGAIFLDEREPGWFVRLDVAKLDLSSCFRCVLGQLAGGEAVRVPEGYMSDPYNARKDALKLSGEDAVSYGFTFGHGAKHAVWHALTDAWKAEISQRLEAEDD